MKSVTASGTVDARQYQSLINALADQLCPAVDGLFDFLVRVDSADEAIQKLQVLINFVLDSARRSVAELEGQRRALETEIAERHLAQESLRESEQRLQATFDCAHTGIVIVDADTHVIVDANSAALQMIGATKSEIVGRLCHQYICPSAQGHCPISDLGQPVDNAERVLLRSDGRSIPILKTVTGMVLKGRRYLLESFVGLDERKRAEEQLEAFARQQSAGNALLRIGLENLPLEETLQRCLDEILFNTWLNLAPRGAIFLVEDDPQVLVLKVHRNLAAPLQTACARVAFGKCLCGRAAAGGRVVFADHVDDRHETTYGSISPHGHYCVPIRSADDVRGVLVVYVEAGHRHSEVEEHFLETAANTIASIVLRKETEQQFRQSEARHRMITEVAQDAIITVDAAGCIRFWNAAAQRIFGYSAAEVIGKNMTGLIVPPKDRAVRQADFAVFAATGRSEVLGRTVELSGLRKDGAEFPVEVSVSAYSEQQRHFAVVLVRDITERKRVEQVLQESEARMRTLDAAHDALVMQALAETLHQHVALNQLQQELLGPGNLPDKLKKITAAAVQLFGVDFCRIWITKPGDLCQSGCVHAAITEGPHVCRYRDRCLHLMASSGRYTHTDGQIHRRVPFGCYKIGRVASEAEHKFLTNKAATDPRVHNHDWVKELGLVSFAGYQLHPPGGETIGVLALFSKFVITPEVDAMLEGLANAAAQVIQRARAEEDQTALQSQLTQAQRLESVGQLAAGIAHEINTPTQFVSDNMRFLQSSLPKLQGLLGRYRELLDACRAGPAPPSLLDELEAAIRGAKLDYLLGQIPEALSDSLEGLERVTKIVRAMKDFAHPGQASMSPADLNKAIESTVTVARNEWKYVAELQLDLDPQLPQVPCLLGDFNQVILNIVVNAAHAIKDVLGDGGQGKGTISISTRSAGDHVEVRISDTGGGIPEEHRARVFEHFFTTKAVGKGTGQGLAIARCVIVEKHHGTLTFETETGKGTTFIIGLPLEPEAKATTVDPLPLVTQRGPVAAV